MKNKKTKNIQVVISLLTIIHCNCLITSRTARITAINTNVQSVSAETILDDGFSGDLGANIKYSFRRGISNKYEVGFSAELLHPSISLGGKYGFKKWWALDINAGLAANVFDGKLFPIGDFAIIFGNTGLYGGIKYEVFTKGTSSSNNWYDTDGSIHPFLGFEIKLNDRINVLPEICIGSLTLDYKKGIQPGQFLGFAGVGVSF